MAKKSRYKASRATKANVKEARAVYIKNSASEVGMPKDYADYTMEAAQHNLPSVKKAIKLLISYKSRLEKDEYFGSKDVETRMQHAISALYDVEIQIKKRAFAGQSRIATQPELLEAIASASKEALRHTLSN